MLKIILIIYFLLDLISRTICYYNEDYRNMVADTMIENANKVRDGRIPFGFSALLFIIVLCL